MAVDDLRLGVGDDVHALIKSAAIAAPGQRGMSADA
jgi:molybdopterin-binding protein